MKKTFLTKAELEKIVETYPTPFHLYDEKGIRENARRLHKAFSWNRGFKEYFAVKAHAQSGNHENTERGGLRNGLLFLYGTASVRKIRLFRK